MSPKPQLKVVDWHSCNGLNLSKQFVLIVLRLDLNSRHTQLWSERRSNTCQWETIVSLNEAGLIILLMLGKICWVLINLCFKYPVSGLKKSKLYKWVTPGTVLSFHLHAFSSEIYSPGQLKMTAGGPAEISRTKTFWGEFHSFALLLLAGISVGTFISL